LSLSFGYHASLTANDVNVTSMEISQDLLNTRRNKYKLVQHWCHYDLRKFNQWLIPTWHTLSSHVVSCQNW